MMERVRICILLVCIVFAAGDICKPKNRLQAVSQFYKINENHSIFGLLGACPPAGEQLDDVLQFLIIDEGNVSGLSLLDARTGEFSFEPAPNFIGVVSFSYRVSDSSDRNSTPAKVIISIGNNPDMPLLELHDITAVEGTYVPMGIGTSVGEDGVYDGRLTVTFCDCDETFTCDRHTGRCDCLLSLPDGWELADGLQRRLLYDELTNLSADKVQNLTLKTQVNSNGHHCLDVHVVNWDVETEEPLTSKRKLLIAINSSSSVPVVIHARGSSTHDALQLETREGQVIKFGGLRVQDSDDTKGTYRVQVSVDQGGTLWVKQDERSDVIFFPKETDNPDWDASDNDKEYRKLERFGNFYETYDTHDTQASNNGKKHLSFVGSLDGINHVLTSMVYVPWCPHWPTPPNWNVPESSWMDPSNYDQLMSDDPLKPVIWPQWYPRFWYPFPRKNWTWWPRVLPPWWINQTCSDWTSRVQMKMREITPETCDAEDTDIVHWYADVHVMARAAEPKSLIADNLFTYFAPTAQSFLLKNLYIRSKEETFQLRFTLGVVEYQLATIEDTDTSKPSFTCTNVPECNNHLQKVQVHLLEGVQDVCKVTIEIRMYKDDSERLSDYMMLWAYKTAPECINYLYYDPETTIEPAQEQITVGQGETVRLDLRYSSSAPDQSGILHTVIYADHGLVTVSAPDGLRVYMDHMGQHEHIPTYLCISGPTEMVLEALMSAKFTPFKNFKGQTTVKIDYTVPSTALKETYGIDVKPPMRRAIVNFSVVNGNRPYFPLLEIPSKTCISEMDLLALDMIRIEGRYSEDERVTLSLVTLKGRLIVERSRIAEIYECPEQTDAVVDAETVCTEECSFHTACPGTQLCCHHGCNRVCTEPERVATIESDTTQNINIHGKISTINRVLEAENFWYLAKPCQTDDTGGIVTDRVIETQEDAIRIEVIPARHPDGDSVLGTLFVTISCMPPFVKQVSEEEDSSSECHEEWGPWRDCQLQEGICGRGTQMRQGQCGAELLRQERPCVICGCKPVLETLVDPSAHLKGCTSDRPIKRCPLGCDVNAHHLVTHSFSCITTGDTDSRTRTDQKTIEVHDSCICNSCLTYG